MKPHPGSIFKSGFTILSVLALLAGESGASSIRWCGITPHHAHGMRVQYCHSLYNQHAHYNYQAAQPQYHNRPVARPYQDCYLPSDGRPSEYSVQN